MEEEIEDYRNEKKVEKIIDLPDDVEALRFYFKDKLACPIPISEGSKYEELKDELLWLWEKICWSYSIDVEAKHIYDDEAERDFQLGDDDYYELKPLAFNLSTWIDKAKEEFLDKTTPVTSLMADSTVYDKHYLRKPLTLEEVKKLAIKNDCSYFYTDYAIPELEKILINTIKPFFQEIISSRNIRYAVSCNKNVGITNLGNETSFLLIEINSTSKVAHAYPCEKQEAFNKIRVMKRKVKDGIDYWWNDAYWEEDPEGEIDIKLICNLNLDRIIKV